MATSNKQILQGIIEKVDEHGRYDISLSTLQDSVFKPSEKIGGAVKEQILIWAANNQLSYKYIKKDRETIVRFSKNSKSTK